MENKAVVDTNVVVSALLSKGKHTAVTEIMEKLGTGELLPIVSEDILREYEDVLTEPKFNFSPEMVDTVLSFFRSESRMADPWDTGMELADPSDLPFFEAYIAEQSPETFLVTGNIKHYPEWPYIVTPREMVELLVG